MTRNEFSINTSAVPEILNEGHVTRYSDKKLIRHLRNLFLLLLFLVCAGVLVSDLSLHSRLTHMQQDWDEWTSRSEHYVDLPYFELNGQQDPKDTSKRCFTERHKLQFSSVVDSHGAFNESSQRLIVPKTGHYLLAIRGVSKNTSLSCNVTLEISGPAGNSKEFFNCMPKINPLHRDALVVLQSLRCLDKGHDVVLKLMESEAFICAKGQKLSFIGIMQRPVSKVVKGNSEKAVCGGKPKAMREKLKKNGE